MAAEEDELRTNLFTVLLNRFQDLEASHAKLTEQFEMMVKEREEEQRRRGGEECLNSSWGRLPGVFSSRSPYGRVLQLMGNAVYVCRASDGEIVYWNRSAETLYGWKHHEVYGRRLEDLFIEEHNCASVEKIMERLSIGESWSGQFPCKKRSGELFMALITKSPLYEDGDFVGVITVSSEAAAFGITNSENLRTYHSHADVPPKEPKLNMTRIQWHPQPQIVSVPQISSSVSNLALKAFSRRRGGDDSCGACASSRNGEPSPDTEDAKAEKGLKPTFRFPIGKNTTEGNNHKKAEPILGFVHPSKIAEKVLGKLNIRGRVNQVQEESRSVQSHSFAGISPNNAMGSALNPPRVSRGMSLEHHYVGIEKMGVVKHENLDGKGTRNQHKLEGDSSVTNRNPFVTSWLECDKCYEIPKIGIPQTRLTLEEVVEEPLANPENLEEALEAEATVHKSPKITMSPTLLSSIESTGSSHGYSSSKGDDESIPIDDTEIQWEDLYVGEEIGRGSYAVVHRGVWNGSDVAIKVYFASDYHEETLLDYKKEITIMKRLRHPNVLLFMGAVYSPERLAMVTEFLPRGSLFKTLHRNGQSLDIRRRLRMALDVARGVNYLHLRKPPIVHRDLKSSNLLVDRNWTVKVGDFGLSKWKNATFLTAKSGRGTPQWMAPEVLRNEPSNEKSDVFSFGVILWELVTESIPWANLNSLQVVGIVGFMDRRLDIPEGMDPRLSNIIQDCWESVPESRPSFQDLIQRMTDLIQELRAAPAHGSSEP